MIRAPAVGGVSVLLTTRYLGEPDALAGDICVIDWPAVHICARLMETLPPSATNTW
jgi:hypothetical protein